MSINYMKIINKNLKVTFVISSNKSEDIFVSQHDSLINLGFAEPGAFLSGAEDFDCNVLTVPATAPYLAEAAFTDNVY